MDPVRNPYSPGAGTPPPALVGRDAEIRDFEIAIQRLGVGRPAKSLYTEAARAKANSHDVEVFSMDDLATCARKFHRLPFSRAVGHAALSDYADEDAGRDGGSHDA